MSARPRRRQVRNSSRNWRASEWPALTLPEREAMEIRPLTNGDLFAVVAMLKKVGDSAGSGRLTELFSSATAESGKKEPDMDAMSIRLGFMVLSELYNNLVGDLQAWLASLYNLSLPEYMALPPDTTIDAIEQLAEGEETKRFFSRAWQLYKKMSSYGNRLPAKSK
jgi:hypothetical protein